MKPAFVLTIGLFAFQVLFAQQISVEAFRRLDNDMDARITHARKDQNGDVCAIIKIVTTETGFTFEGGSLGIVHSEQKVAEIWVWVPHKAQRMTIKHPVLGVLRDYPYPENIEKATVYEMKLTTGRVRTVVEAPVIESQWLVISTEPADAMIYLNDQFETRGLLQKKVRPGAYTYRAEAPLHHTEAGKIQVTPEQKVKLDLKLKPAYGYAKIVSTPEAGAAILIDGKDAGLITPATTARLASGEHTITVIKEQFQPASRKVNITDGQTTELNLSMAPNFGTVQADLPAGATLLINGDDKGKGKWSGRLNPGVYTFEARHDKHRPARQDVQISAGDSRQISLMPLPMTGNLDVLTRPPDARILLDGNDMGTTPTTLDKLLIGDYQLVLEKPGHARITKTINITEGSTALVDETLQPATSVQETTNPASRFSSATVSGGKNITETASGLNLEMVFVKGGTFTMGCTAEQGSDCSDSENPAHTVTLSDFYIGKYEVTQKQWMAIMGSNPSYFKGCDDCPVERVSWNDIQEFIKKLNQKTGKQYRLPTEAEWEYAARGGSTGSASTGSAATGSASTSSAFATKYAGSNNIDEVAWYSSNSGSKTRPVGGKKPNGLGIYDMSGNVWEWCADWKGSYSSGSQTNPQGPASGSLRVLRGGSWIDGPQRCRVTYRSNTHPDNRNNSYGFRLALSP
jgi:formylglycine-generating enzyme required for sulfatase activity